MMTESQHDQLDSFSAGLPDVDPQTARARAAVERAKQRGLIQTAGPGAGRAATAQPSWAHQRPRVERIDRDKNVAMEAAALAGVRTRWMNVTPEMAADWLANNVRNRTLSKDVVAAYAREMRAGRWLPIHQGIAFNNVDELIDGQHRLHAIVKSGMTVRLMVTFGMPSRVNGQMFVGMDVVDRGKPRTVADQLKIQHGIKNGGVLAMVCSRLAAICTPQRTRRLSVAEVLEIWGEFEQAVDFVIDHRSKEHGLKQAGVMAGFAFAIAGAQDDGDRDWHETSYRCVLSGDGLKPGEPLGQLREFLVSEAAVLLGRGNDRALAELVMQAAFLQGKNQRVSTLELSDEGITHYRALAAEKVATVAAMFEFSEEGEA